MEIPIEQIVLGIFGLLGAAVTGTFSIYNTRIARKLTKIQENSGKNDLLVIENDILEQLVPVFERKDEALDKISDILVNILQVQKLQNTKMTTLEIMLKNKCQAPELIEAINSIVSLSGREGVNKGLLHKLIDNYENTEDT